MSLTAKDLRELRRYLRASSDNLQDAADLIGVDDREQQRRMRGIAREIESEIDAIDKKITEAQKNGGAKQ